MVYYKDLSFIQAVQDLLHGLVESQSFITYLYLFPVENNADQDKNLVKGEFIGKFTTPAGLTVSKF